MFCSPTPIESVEKIIVIVVVVVVVDNAMATAVAAIYLDEEWDDYEN